MDKKNGHYARAHALIIEKIQYLKGERLTREQWWKLCNINLNNPDHIPFKDAVNAVLWNMSEDNKKKLIAKEGTYYKVVDNTLTAIDFKSLNGDKPIDLMLPFGIHRYCYLYRKNVMIVFGSKDSGKTSMCLNIIRMNMKRHKINYFSSEMGDTELKKRLLRCKDLELDDWNFKAWERSYDFHEAVAEYPDDVNIIDFLELGGDEAEYYKAVSFIRKIYDATKNITIIALQKNKNAELPKGGSGALEKARIALSLDPGMAKLVVAKNWADGVEHNPAGKAWSYQLVGGINIVNPMESIVED